ncbi:HNH endonuclease signature motif containing protein [Gordonia sinesedis]
MWLGSERGVSTVEQLADIEPQSDAALLIAEVHALLDRLADADLSQCSDAELVEVAVANERAIARLAATGDQQVVEIANRDLPRACGYRSLVSFMNHRLRMSNPSQRRKQAAATARFDTLTGQPREPQHPTLAAALADGRVGTAHVRAVLDVLEQIPHSVEHDVQVAAEQTMTEIAVEHTPHDISRLGQRLLAHLDPDGALSDDSDRARRRNLWVNRQRADGMAKLTGHLDPLTNARLQMMLAVWAKPGMNNPDDPDSPSGSEDDANVDALREAAGRDTRSQAQRNHDALNALLTAVFDDGLLGTSHRGLPVQLIIKADLSDLKREAGLATTATDSLLPISDVIKLAADAQPFLAVFKDHTAAAPLFLGRRRRLASREQRLMSFAAPDGETCSTPGCDQPAAQVELHHAAQDWADGGRTDITDLAPGCPTHNRMVGKKPGQYTTSKVRSGPDEGRARWQLNTRPGAPPNPASINRTPDLAARLAAHLRCVRADIHRPPDGDPRGDAPSGEESPPADDGPSQEPGLSRNNQAAATEPTTPAGHDSLRDARLTGAGWAVTKLVLEE